MPKNVVFIWELGDNFGHIAAFAGVARKLHKKGYRLTAILQNLEQATHFFSGLPVQLLQAPVARRRPLHAAPQTYTDDIRNCGYLDAAGLQGLLSGWKALYALIQPDVVVFNAAPTAMAAAKKETFHKIAVGHGYEIPPPLAPLPVFRAADKPDEAAAFVREKQVLAVLNEALAAVDIPAYKQFCEVFRVDATLLSCTQELDHYPLRKEGRYIGALPMLHGGRKLAWPASAGKRIFAYVRPESKFFVSTMQALHALSRKHAILVSAPGISAKNIQTLSTPTLKVVPEALQIAALRKTCDLAICHAGIGTVSAFLEAGVPLLLLPNHIEQWMMAQNVLRLGAGAMPKGAPTQKLMQTAIEAMLATPGFRARAQAYRKKYGGASGEKAEQQLVQAIAVTCSATRRPRSPSKSGRSGKRSVRRPRA